MTPPPLTPLQSERLRAAFPHLSRRVYLDTAAVGLAFAGQGAAVARFFDAMKSQGWANKVTWDHLAAWKLPVLVITGDADLYTPPSMMRLIHSRIPGAEKFLVPDCGHSAYWERPEIFNRVVLDFMDRHEPA